MKKSGILVKVSAALVLALIAFLGGVWVLDNRLPNYRTGVDLYVYPGDTPDDVIEKLSDKAIGVGRLKRVFLSKKVAEYITPGHYFLRPKDTAVYTARMLNNGWQTPVRLTLSGTLRSKQKIASRISSQMLADSASLMAAMNDRHFLKTLLTSPETIYEIIIPDTYEILWTASPEEIFTRLKSVDDAFWTDERNEKAQRLGLSHGQVVTLASIVNAETNCKSEMPKVAGVYLNRLTIGMPLQADPTIAFCLDYNVNRILRRHLKIDSPYNTYTHRGLPPGPICVPSTNAIDAVLNADYGTPDGKSGKNGNLYFCASPEFNGTHNFARSYQEHSANAARYQEALDRRALEKQSTDA